MMKLLNSVVFISYICLSQGIKIKESCPTVEPVSNFDLEKFGKGIWHEHARYENGFESTNCGSFEFIPKGNKIKTEMLGAARISPDSPKYVEALFGLSPGAENKGDLLHELTSGNPPKTSYTREYILDVDYDKYYIGYVCNFDEKTQSGEEWAWVIARSKELDSATKAAIDDYIKTSKFLDASKFIWLDTQDPNCD